MNANKTAESPVYVQKYPSNCSPAWLDGFDAWYDRQMDRPFYTIIKHLRNRDAEAIDEWFDGYAAACHEDSKATGQQGGAV
jgi:hypothetical protein